MRRGAETVTTLRYEMKVHENARLTHHRASRNTSCTWADMKIDQATWSRGELRGLLEMLTEILEDWK